MRDACRSKHARSNYRRQGKNTPHPAIEANDF
jgi:hypothetical protein